MSTASFTTKFHVLCEINDTLNTLQQSAFEIELRYKYVKKLPM